MHLLLAFALVVSVAPARAQTVDRVVASVGNIAITEGDVEARDRFEIFLGPERSRARAGTAEFDQVRDRLIDQKVLTLEADATGVPRADRTAAAERLAEVRKRYNSEQAFDAALQAPGMSEQQVLERLGEQERILRMIDQRLRPNVVVQDSDVRAYYRNTFLPHYPRRSEDPPPPLTEVEKQIREILVETKMNQELSRWLEQLRSRYRVRIHAF